MSNIEELKSRIETGETSARAIVEFSLDSAAELNETLNAFLDLDRTEALKRAGGVQVKAADQSPRQPLDVDGVIAGRAGFEAPPAPVETPAPSTEPAASTQPTMPVYASEVMPAFQ